MQSAQATPTSSSSPLDHQGSAIGNFDSDPSQPDNNSNNKPQHPISTSELKKFEADLEERHRISMECMIQNLSMQHERDLQIVRDEAQRKIDDAFSQARLSEEKAIARSRKIEDLQSQMNQLSQLIRQQQQTPPNIATPQYNMQNQQNFTLPLPTHTQDMINQSINNTLIGVLDRFDKSMVQWDSVLHESLRQSVTASKEHYLSSAKSCDGKIARDFSIWLEDVSRISGVSGKDPESVALATSRASLHTYVRELHSSGKHWSAMKPLLQERFSECGNSTMAKHKLTTFRQTDLAMHEYISKFTDLVEHAYTLSPTDPASKILATNFTEGIKNPHIKNKLRSHKISNLQDIFKFALEEDQKQKIRALGFEVKPDTIAHCDIQAIKGNNCYKCGNEGHFIKNCPLLQNNATHHHNPTPHHKQPYAPYSESNNNSTDMLAPITQTLSNLLDQLQQLSMINTNSHSTSSHHKSHHNNTDRHNHKYHNRDTKHNSNYNRNKSHKGNTHNRTHHSRHNHRTRLNEIEEFSECSSDCTDLSDYEEQVNAETPDNSKN